MQNHHSIYYIYSVGIFRTEDVLVKETDLTLRKMFTKEVKYNKTLMFGLMVIYGSTVLQIAFVSAFLWTQFQAFVFPVNWYPFGLVESHGFFVAVHQTLTGLYSGVIFLGLDISFVPLIIFATTRLKLLCHKIKHFKQYTKSSSMSSEDYLRVLVLEHQDIIRLGLFYFLILPSRNLKYKERQTFNLSLWD